MNQLAKLALVVAVAFGIAPAYALDYEKNKPINDNWGNGSNELVWKNGSDELCWRDNFWTPATANSGCDGAIVAQKVVTVAPPAPVVTPEPATPEPVAPIITTEKITLAADALFDFDKAILKPEGKIKLDELYSKLQDIKYEVITATGHTDSIGSAAYNQKLSMRRAQAVKAYLTKKGVEAKNVYADGKGESQPVASNKNSAGRAKNRRVEIEVVGTRTVRAIPPTQKK